MDHSQKGTVAVANATLVSVDCVRVSCRPKGISDSCRMKEMIPTQVFTVAAVSTLVEVSYVKQMDVEALFLPNIVAAVGLTLSGFTVRSPMKMKDHLVQ